MPDLLAVGVTTEYRETSRWVLPGSETEDTGDEPEMTRVTSRRHTGNEPASYRGMSRF